MDDDDGYDDDDDDDDADDGLVELFDHSPSTKLFVYPLSECNKSVKVFQWLPPRTKERERGENFGRMTYKKKDIKGSQAVIRYQLMKVVVSILLFAP